MNLLGINPFLQSPLCDMAIDVGRALDKFHSNNPNIQIEFKCAELKSFFESHVVDHLKSLKLPSDIERKVIDSANYYALQQNGFHFNSLKTLSKFNLICLNHFERYRLTGDFNEETHRCFYKIRDFLVKLCRENSNSKSHGIDNIYRNIIHLIEGSRGLKMINFSEMRLDVNISGGDHAGRYSYLLGSGWTKTKKENLIRQEYDLMMSQKTFRLAVKSQNEQTLTMEQARQVMDSVKEGSSKGHSKGGYFMRFKRSLKVQKEQLSIITLSEVYQPPQARRQKLFEDLKDLLLMGDQNGLDGFIVERFQEFYMTNLDQNPCSDDRSNKFEIQSQFTKEAVNRMHNMFLHDDIKNIQKYLDQGLQDLYAFYFVDHNISSRETAVMQKMMRSGAGFENNFPECRLKNQYGTYMHDLIYNFMKE